MHTERVGKTSFAVGQSAPVPLSEPGKEDGAGVQAKVLLPSVASPGHSFWFAKVLAAPPAIEAAPLAFDLQPVGGGAPVTTLAPHTAYELHYAAQADGVTFYFLYAAAASSASSLDRIEPAVTGPWSDDRLFVFEHEAGDMPPAPNHPGLRWTDHCIDFHYLSLKAKGDAPSAAHACTITTGDSGPLTLDLWMFRVQGEPGQPTVIMESSARFAVQAP